MSGKVRLNQAALRAELERLAGNEVRSTTRKIFNRSQRLAPVDSGRLRSSGKMTVRKLKGRIEYNVNYAAAVHDGVAGHIVFPRRAKALRFQYRGRPVFAKYAVIPGREGNPFLVRAAKEITRQDGGTYHHR